MTFFGPLFTVVDDTLNDVVTTSATNLAAYVNSGVATVGVIMVVLLGIQLAFPQSGFPMKRIMSVLLTLFIVSAVATVPANYHDYISEHLMQLPGDLAAAVTGDSEYSNIGVTLDNTIGQILDGISRIFTSGGMSLKPLIIGTMLFVTCCMLCLAAVICIMMGKVGLALVVGLGPLFMLFLLSPWTKDMFTRWLSYALHLAVLQALVAASLLVTIVLVNRFVIGIGSPGWDYGDLVPIFAPTLVMLVLAFLFSQLPSIASSITGGIGLSAGNLAWTGTAAGMGYAGAGAAAAGRGMLWGAGKAWGAMRGGGSQNSVSERQGGNAVVRSGSAPGRNRNPGDNAASKPASKFGTAAAIERMKRDPARQNDKPEDNK